jgi:hypothetical protein
LDESLPGPAIGVTEREAVEDVEDQHERKVAADRGRSMTARQRQASGSVAATVPAESSPANGVVNGEAASFRWADWFAGASADQRAAALALAERQGLLYLQQLPASHGKTQRGAGAQPVLVPFLTRLLTGKSEALSPVSDEPLAWFDPHLDPMQREAVRRALNTPDVCLLRGLPGTGKSRVVTEAVVQAARRGWRILLLAPTAPAVDVVLERLAGCADVLPIRLLAADESASTLPPAVRGLTLPEQRRAFRASALAGARQARRLAEETCQRRLRDAAIWPQLPPIAERHTEVEARLRTLMQRTAAVSGEVEREAAALPSVAKGSPSGPFAAELVELHKRVAAALAESQAAHQVVREKQDALRHEMTTLTAQLIALEPKCRARAEQRWWTLAYWTGGSAPQQREAAQARQLNLDAELRDLGNALVALAEQRRKQDATHEAERQDLIRGEVERRQQEFSAELTMLERERQLLRATWQPLCEAIEPAELRPAELSTAAIEAARQRWQPQSQRDDEGCQFARQWADYLERAGDELLPRLPALANVLAGPIGALARGREGPEASDTGYDLVIVEEAEMVTESELLRLAIHAPRMLLVGHAAQELPAASGTGRAPPRGLHSLQPLPGCWGRLWQALADDLGAMPYTWQREGERLVCHLAAVRPEDVRHLESEGLADAPEIELNILNLPRCRPVLARVSFPGQFTIPQATAFINRELEELPIQPLGRTAWWQETDGAWVLHLGPLATAITDRVDLGAGVGMGLIAEGQDYAGRATRLDFSKADGWDRAAARRWLQARLQLRDRERTVFLQVPHRMVRPLAEVVGPLLFPEVCLCKALGTQAATETPFEFVAVPAPRQAEWPREGAGLEQDLSAGRHGDRVPSELRAELPRKGLVNFLEAQALIRRLERWAQTPAELGASGSGTPSVLVLALYEAQAEMLRRLTARSPILQARTFALEISVPGQAHHRECDVLVLSLTRSHAHRCVPYGEDIADLAMALTRARQRLLVFGDLGTLFKRTQWQGPLDHLDAPEAHLEGLHLSRLLQQIQSA